MSLVYRMGFPRRMIPGPSARAIAGLTLAATLLAPCIAAPNEDPRNEPAPDFNPASAVFLGGLPARPPETALVLSGGGARGAAHIGVLKVLEELQIVPDLIVGTSMGSIVGGLYAAGYSPEEIQQVLESIDWTSIFSDRVTREQKSFRRKQDDDVFLIPLSLRFRGLKPYLPAGILGGLRLELTLRSLTVGASATREFDDLPIPYRAVAADIASGEAVVLGAGLLSDAMRASMSIAGAFAPVEWEGRRLVDGGAVANVPIGIAQHMGARRIIAVDISSPLDESVEQKSFFGIMSQLSGLLTVGNRALDISRLREQDVLIRPDLGDITFTSFSRAADAVQLGEEAARESLGRLREFSATAERWSAFQRDHHRRDLSGVLLERLDLDNTSWVDDRIVLGALHVPTGVALDYDELSDELLRLNALEYFGKIREEYREVDGAGELTITTPAKPYSRGSLQFGLSLETDLDSDSSYTLTARHKVLALNRRGGEWVNVVQIGSDTLLETQFYQPLDWKMRWFVEPSLRYARTRQALWLDGTPVADYSFTYYGGRLDAGRVLGNWGELRAGAFRWSNSASPRIGLPIFPAADVEEGGVSLTFRVDTLDTVVFPTRGTSALVGVERTLDSFGADVEGTVARLNVNHAFSLGRTTVVLGVEASDFVEGSRSSPRTSAVLGGFLRLSGLGRNELLGEKGGFARAVFYHDLVRMRIGALANRVFVGASIETGNAYGLDEAITWSSLRSGGSVFVGAETVAGPAYLGWGWTEPDRDRWYLVFGQRF